jgi:predicted transcriptional regulator
MRRDRFRIWFDILRAIEVTTPPVRPTHIQTAVNLPHDRFQARLAELEARHLLVRQPLQVTEDGRNFLRTCEEFDQRLRRWTEAPLLVQNGRSF